MSAYDLPSALDAARADPVRCGLFVLVPAFVAGVQLLNTAVNGLSPTVSVPFATVLLVFSAAVLQLHIASIRVSMLESDARRDERRPFEGSPDSQ